jgi:mannose-6-phosphate isomerase
MEKLVPDIYPLRAHMQHYAWGDPVAIPRMLHLENPSGKPCAEYWMGAHPDLPFDAELGGHVVPLNELIAKHPRVVLGNEVARAFDDRLPFLFKLLAAAEPLSIQVHPSKQAAEQGFLKENELGVPLNAPHRNYRDDNHKPELMMALEPFYGLRGFRPFEAIKETLESVPEFNSFAEQFSGDAASLKAVYERFMRMKDEEVHQVLHPVVERLKSNHLSSPYSKSDREYWVLRSDACYSGGGRHDRGLFAVFLLNLVCLQPGQAMFLPAGVLHAYLEGVGMELMANSNNVLRGGLTPKHVDVGELIREVAFEGESIEILEALPDTNIPGLARFVTTASEFELQRMDAKGGPRSFELTSRSPEILFPSRANAKEAPIIRGERDSLTLTDPKPVLICCGLNYTVELPEGLTLFRAIVPI